MTTRDCAAPARGAGGSSAPPRGRRRAARPRGGGPGVGRHPPVLGQEPPGLHGRLPHRSREAEAGPPRPLGQGRPGRRSGRCPRRCPRRTSLALGPLGQGGHGVVLVVEVRYQNRSSGSGPSIRSDRVLHDDGQLVGEGGVVDGGGRVGRGQQGRVAVVVLEPLAVQGGAAGGAAGQDAPAPDVAEGPDQVADPLEAEHRVEEVDRQHGLAPGGVGGGQGGERGHRPGLGDALLEELARGALGVAEGQVGVDRRVALALGGVDLGLGDDRLEPEGAGLVGDDRGHQRAEGRVADEVPQQPGEGHGGRDGLGARARP